MKHRFATMITGLSLLATAAAQEFVFVSNRLPAQPEFGSSGRALQQNEIFLYRDGSEIRLTFTSDQDEWDPTPSPSGDYLAYVVNDRIIDWDAPEFPSSWNWYLRIMDLESGLLLEEWQIPTGADTTRMAGGFDIEWYSDEQALLVQVTNAQHDPRIARFEVGKPSPRVLTRGVAAHLDESRGWFATTIEGYATVYDPNTGANYPLASGESVGWHDGRVLVGGPGQLLLIDPVTAQRTQLDSGADYYPSQFVTSPDGSRHAWLAYSSGEVGTTITVTDADFSIIDRFRHDFVEDIRWLDDGRLLLSGMLGGNMALTSLNLADGQERLLVATLSDNMLPEILPGD